MRKFFSVLAMVLVLTFFTQIPLVSENSNPVPLSISIELIAGIYLYADTPLITFPIVAAPEGIDEWIPASNIVTFTISWRMIGGSSQKLVCSTAGLLSNMSGWCLPSEIFMKQIWTSDIPELNIELPGPIQNGPQDIATFPRAREYGTAQLQLMFLNQAGELQVENFAGEYVYTILGTI